MLKDIRIFIASSKELNQERNELAFLVLAKEDEFAARGLRVRLAKWEYVDPKMTAGRTEDRYLDEMYNCDAAMVIFKNIAGMYTREELDKALAREAAGSDRIKTHKILFSTEGKPDSDAAKLRVSLPEENYGVYANLEELKAAFLALVDEVAKSGRLIDVQDENLHEVSAFVAADDELASDRNAFADTILNLNDILARRGIRVRMRFYDPEHHRELLESSEMALVLYDTNYKAFNPEQMYDAYERTKREENPKRLYVFFRDEEESKLDQAFVEFRNGFAENLGHFFCRFENADTLKLNFLLSLENALGDGAEFVKLDGKKIKADELEIAEITRLPMVVNNEQLSAQIAQVDLIAMKFDELSAACRNDPDNEDLYKELLLLSTKKNELESQVNKELSQSFGLAKRMASVSAKEANETIAKARFLLDQGRADEAIELLDGPSSSLDDILGALGDTDDLISQQLSALEAQIDVQLFRADTVLAYARDPFPVRFAKAESIYKVLLAKVGKMLMTYRKERLAKLLFEFAGLYSRVKDTKSQIPILDKAVKLYRSVEVLDPNSHRADIARVLLALAGCHKLCNQLELAEKEYAESVEKWRSLQKETPHKWDAKLADSLSGFGDLKEEVNKLGEAEGLYQESLFLRRELARGGAENFRNDVAYSLRDLAALHKSVDRLEEAEQEYSESLDIVRSLAESNPDKFRASLANSLSGLGDLYEQINRLDDAERMYSESLEIRKRLAENNPARYNPNVADSLMDLAGLHSNLSQKAKAEAEYREALSLRKGLVSINPEEFGNAMASTLSELGVLHARSGAFLSAEAEWQESLDIRKKLMAHAPEKFMCAVAASTLSLAKLHHYMKQYTRAADEYEEALKSYRQLAEANPGKYLSSVASALQRYATLKKWCNDQKGAERLMEERYSIIRELMGIAPDKYDDWLSDALKELANLHREMNDHIAADREFSEALEITRRLANDIPEKYMGNLASLLSNYAMLKSDQKDFLAAEQCLVEAVAIMRVRNSFDGVCLELYEIAKLHKRMNKFDLSEVEFSEALELARGLAHDSPKAYLNWLAEILASYGGLKGAVGEFEHAVGLYAEALEIWCKLNEDAPDHFNEDIANTLHNLAALQIENGDKVAARANLERALEMRKALVTVNAEKFADDLAETKALLATVANDR